jgi:hypothetical protein
MSEPQAEVLRGADQWAVAVPLLCAVHCLAAPLLLVIAPSLVATPWMEGALMVVAAGLALPLVMQGVRSHGAWWIWIPAVAGLTLWGVELTRLPVGVSDVALTLGGSTLLAVAILLNARIRHRQGGNECSCPAHR